MIRLTKIVLSAALAGAAMVVLAPVAEAVVPAAKYTAVSPCRVFDTRSGAGGCSGAFAVPVGQLGPAQFRTIQLAGVGDVLPNATAVVLNVTALSASATTYITVYPDGQARPVVSSLNLEPGAVAANQVTVPLSDGKVNFYNNLGETDVVADLAGYYAPSTGAGYVPISPCRAFDTRGSLIQACTGAPSIPATKLGEAQTLRVPIRGVAGIPPAATAVTLNLTGANATVGTYVSVYPTGVARPYVSNLNLDSPFALPNLVTVPIGSDGSITLYNNLGAIDLIGDISGYYTPSGGSAFATITPCRVADTRFDAGTCSPAEPYRGEGTLGAKSGIVLRLPGVSAVPVGATAAVLNVTAAGSSGMTYVNVFPAPPFDVPSSAPQVSNLNVNSSAAVANAVVVSIPPGIPNANTNNFGLVVLYNDSGSVDLIVDMVGYFYVPAG